MNDKSMETAVHAVMDKLRAMSREELRAEIEKRRNSDFAVLFGIAREFDPNFMRLSELKKQIYQEKRKTVSTCRVQTELKQTV